MYEDGLEGCWSVTAGCKRDFRGAIGVMGVFEVLLEGLGLHLTVFRKPWKALYWAEEVLEALEGI